MTKKTKYISAIIFSLLIIIANYTVQIPINDWLTYGALVFPFTFLLTDILSEKYLKDEVLEVVGLGIYIAIIPTVIIADWRIAFASIFTFYVVQQLDVKIFHYFKQKFVNLWWFRNNASTMISSFFDTVLFFTIAFAFIMPMDVIIKLIIGDYLVKLTLALLDTPIFYLVAIRFKKVTSKNI